MTHSSHGCIENFEYDTSLPLSSHPKKRSSRDRLYFKSAIVLNIMKMNGVVGDKPV